MVTGKLIGKTISIAALAAVILFFKATDFTAIEPEPTTYRGWAGGYDLTLKDYDAWKAKRAAQ